MAVCHLDARRSGGRSKPAAKPECSACRVGRHAPDGQEMGSAESRVSTSRTARPLGWEQASNGFGEDRQPRGERPFDCEETLPSSNLPERAATEYWETFANLTQTWKCPPMQAIVRGQVCSPLPCGAWATGSSLLGDEESIVKNSPKTSRPVSTPPINMIDSSFSSLRRGRSPEPLIGTGLYFL